MPAGAPKGNQYRVSLDTPEIRQKVYDDYCSHIAKGKAIKSWYYDKDGYLICWEAFTQYLKKYSTELDPIKKKMAYSKGYQIWEGIAEESAKGTNKKANTASLQMVMRNKFGWDKIEKEEQRTPVNQENIDKDHQIMMLQNELEKLKNANQPKAEPELL